MVYAEGGNTSTEDVPEDERRRFSLSDDDIHELAKQAVIIEEHYGRPMDIEWGKTAQMARFTYFKRVPRPFRAEQGE